LTTLGAGTGEGKMMSIENENLPMGQNTMAAALSQQTDRQTNKHTAVSDSVT